MTGPGSAGATLQSQELYQLAQYLQVRLSCLGRSSAGMKPRPTGLVVHKAFWQIWEDTYTSYLGNDG